MCATRLYIGCAFASRLHARVPDKTIALLERGLDEVQHPYVQDPLSAGLLPNTSLVQTYKTIPQPTLANREITNYAGNILSGSSAINYGAWMRADSADYDHWAELSGNSRWSYQHMLPYLKGVEHHHNPNVDQSIHGLSGPVHSESGRQYPLRQVVHEAYKAAGFEEIQDVNSGSPLGVAPWVENWHGAKRQPASSVYDLEGVHVITGHTVSHVLIEGKRAKGVVFTDGSRMFSNCETIISCGAHRTPQILILSGIGPEAELVRLGIPMVSDCPDVGQNFFDHLALHQAWQLRPDAQKCGAAAGHTLFNKPEYAGGIPVEWVGTGAVPSQDWDGTIKAENGNASVSRQSTIARAHFQIMTAYSPLSLGDGHDVPIDGTHISTGALLYHPTSRGSISLSSTDPTVPPTVDPQYYSTKADRQALRYALRKAMQIIEAPSLQGIIQAETPPAGFPALNSTSSDEAIDRRIESFSTVWHHGAGTASMGKVVDDELKVKGVHGLRIADASVFPAPISATLQWTVYAIAEQLADLVSVAWSTQV